MHSKNLRCSLYKMSVVKEKEITLSWAQAPALNCSYFSCCYIHGNSKRQTAMGPHMCQYFSGPVLDRCQHGFHQWEGIWKGTSYKAVKLNKVSQTERFRFVLQYLLLQDGLGLLTSWNSCAHSLLCLSFCVCYCGLVAMFESSICVLSIVIISAI